MAINFPANPAVDDTFLDPNGITWLCTYASPNPIRWEKVVDLDTVAITDSTINSTIIGGATPADGTFVDVIATQDITSNRNLSTVNLLFSGSVDGILDAGTFDAATTASMRQRRSESLGQIPVFVGGAADYGKLAVNLADKIIYVAGSTGAAIKMTSPSKVMSETPPDNPNDGQEWGDTTSGLNYTWFEDGDSGQWLADVAQDNGGGIDEAPVDSNRYARRNNAWTIVDQTDAEIEIAYNNEVPEASQLEMEIGVETEVRRMTPERVAQAIGAIAAKVQFYYSYVDFTDIAVTVDTDTTSNTAFAAIGSGVAVNIPTKGIIRLHKISGTLEHTAGGDSEISITPAIGSTQYATKYSNNGVTNYDFRSALNVLNTGNTDTYLNTPPTNYQEWDIEDIGIPTGAQILLFGMSASSTDYFTVKGTTVTTKFVFSIEDLSAETNY